MTHKLSNGEWACTWTCPKCHTEQHDSIHPIEGPFLSCTCGDCGRSFSNNELDPDSETALELAREAAAPELSQEESTQMKRAFKNHFAASGYDAALPPELAAQRDANPCEWAEVCEEFERYGKRA